MAGGEDDGKRVNIGVRLMPHTVAALDEAGVRMGGRSRAFVIEVLAALFAGSLNARTAVPVGMMPAGSRSKKRTAGSAETSPESPGTGSGVAVPGDSGDVSAGSGVLSPTRPPPPA